MEIKRFNDNPILTKDDVAFRINSIFNPGAVKYKDEYLLICRIEMPNGRSSLILARSEDGYNFNVDDKPCLTPEDHYEFYDYVEWGIEDSRVTKIEDTFYLTYTGYSKYQPLVILAETKDFKEFKIHGPITEPSNKDCSLFPEKIGGHYYKFDRPSAENKHNIWISKSKDLIHWGEYKCVMEPREGSWETNKVGISSDPIKTDKGWLVLYHGVRGFGISSLYKLGAALFDLNEPWKLLGKTDEPILAPDLDYERVGDVQNVVFCNGWIREDDDSIKIYYSGADTNICIAETSVTELINSCMDN